MWTDRLKSRKTILIVENDTATRTLLCRVLRPAYRIMQASTAEEAVQIAAQHRSQLDLLLTEARLPRMCGWELLELLALDYPRLNVIYVTKTMDPEIRVRTHRQKVVLLEQPFPKSLLQQAVDEVLHHNQPMRAATKELAPSLFVRMRSYLRRHPWLHHPTT